MIKLLLIFALSVLATRLEDCTSLTTGKEPSYHEEVANSKCLTDALLKANASDKLLTIESTVSMMPISVSGLVNLTIRVDGYVLASQRFLEWPTNSKTKNGGKARYLDFWAFNDCDGLTVEGSGTIDG